MIGKWIFSVCVLLVVILVGYTFYAEPEKTPPKPKPNFGQLPLYPDAADLKTEMDKSTIHMPWKRVSYVSGATTEDILTYYRQTLPSDNWMLDESSKPTAMLYAKWLNGPEYPVYTLTINISTLGEAGQPDKQSKVVLDFRSFGVK